MTRMLDVGCWMLFLVSVDKVVWEGRMADDAGAQILSPQSIPAV